MKLKAYPIVFRAVEEGVAYGITRLFKYEDGPFDEAKMRERAHVIEDAIMSELCEVIEFEDEEIDMEAIPEVGASREINTQAGVYAQVP